MKVKLKLPIFELFEFFGYNDFNYNEEINIDRYLKIKTPAGRYTQIHALIRKSGTVATYNMEDGISIRCDVNHLVKSNGKFQHIDTVSSVDTIYGNKKILTKELVMDDEDVFDMALDSPHEYITESGVISHNTTLAKMIVNSIECDSIVINASDENNVDTVRNKIKGFASSKGFKPFKIVILDESDYLTPGSQAILRNLMETFSAHCRFILTCNYIEKIIEPIQSRCQSEAITPPNKKDVAKQLTMILEAENITYDLKDLVPIIDSSYPDIRMAINTLQRQSKSGKLKVDTQAMLDADFKHKIIEILVSKKGARDSFFEIRQIVADNSVRDFSDMYTLLKDKLDEYADGKQTTCILILADRQAQDALVVDKEITFMATIVNILAEIK